MNMQINEENIFDDLDSNKLQTPLDLHIRPLWMEDLMRKQFGETKWLVDKLIPLDSLVALSGAPASFKTFLILELALKISSGEDVFDVFPVKRTKVLIVDEETGSRWLQARLAKLTVDVCDICFLSKTGFKLTPSTTEDLISYCKINGIGFVVFDSLVRIHTAKDENSATEMAKVFSLMQEIVSAGITVLFVHHSRKQSSFRSADASQDMRGSSDILAAVDCHLLTERKKDHILVTQSKLRQYKELTPFKLGVITDDTSFQFEYLGEKDAFKSVKESMAEAIQKLLTERNEPISRTEIYQLLKDIGTAGGYSSFKSTIDDLVKSDVLNIRHGDKNKVFCFIKKKSIAAEPVSTISDLGIEVG